MRDGSILLIYFFYMFMLLALVLVAIITYHFTNYKISKKYLIIMFIIDFFILLLVRLKWTYFFTPFFGEPEGIYMSLSSSGELIYCWCIFLFPIYLSILYWLLLWALIWVRLFLICYKGYLSKLGITLLSIWMILLIVTGLVSSSIYGDYKPYGFYETKTSWVFNKDRNIIIDVSSHYYENWMQ